MTSINRLNIMFLLSMILVSKLHSQSTILGNAGSGIEFLGWNNNFNLRFQTNNFNRAILDNGGAAGGGRFALGNNLPNNFAPQARLHLHHSTNSVVNMLFTNATTGATGNDGLIIGISPAGDAFFINQELNQRFSWYNQGAGPGNLLGRMRLEDGGVGQNTGRLSLSDDLPLNFAAQARLHILQAGTANANGDLFRTDGDAGQDVKWQLFTGATQLAQIEKFRLFAQAGTENIFLNVVQNNGDMHLQTNSLTRVFIKDDQGITAGFVGINTNAPTRRLDVNGKVRVQDLLSNGADAGLVTYFADGTLQQLAFTGNSNQVLLGNGTWGTGGGNVSLCNPNPAVNNVVKVTGLNTICGTNITDLAPAQQFVGINNLAPNDALVISNGNVDVSGAVNSYEITGQPVLWHKGGNTSIFVGVGAGNTNNNLQSQNTYIGYQAGFSSPGNIPTNPSVNNVLVGYQAGFNVQASNATHVGYQAGFTHNGTTSANTFLGYQTGFSTSGSSNDNTMVGFHAGRNNVSGDHNTFMGNLSGFANSSGSFNSFYGEFSGIGNGAFNNNSCFGWNSGANTKGNENTFLGSESGFNGIGNFNVAIGSQAMFAATTGTENVIIGYKANSTSPGSSFNTIIGSQAALANNTGASNTYVGYQSALAQTTGTGNVYVGLESGDNMVGGSGNTFLGIRAGATNANSALLNAAAIGAGAQVTNNNHMILGNNAVNVGIGLSSDPTGPQNKLEINTAAPTSIPGASGLRFRDLTNISTTIANPGPGILSVDANGDVIYVQGPPPSVFGGVCGTNPLALSNNWEIPMATFNYVYTGQGINQTNVGIGTGCVPNAKLQVQQSSGSVLGSIGINVDNDDLTPCFSNDYVIGLKATANLNNAASTISGLYRVAGWFEAPVSNGCGLINNFALYTPQNGGFISFGYPTPSTNGGLLNVNGVTWSSGGYTSSDVTLKNTVTTLPNSLNKIKSLRPVTFKWNTVSDSLMNGTHAGFIAQEVDTVIPQVVRTNGSGVKSVAYSELIPYLVSAIQAQQQQIKQMDSLITLLTQSISSCCSNSAAKQTGIEGNDPKSLSQINVNLSDVDMIVLNQNVPNPFAEQTTITYNVPEKHGFAQLVFKTIDGKIIKTVDITKKGRGQVNVFANDLSNGLYMYSLIVDGTSVDTKKMVKQN